MLVFFIHGVATRDVKYADSMKAAIQEEFDRVGQPLPQFCSSFWGDVLNDVSKMWNCISQDLQQVKKENPQTAVEDVFRYRQFREGFLSEFVGDMFTYLNPTRGIKIRELVADKLTDFINEHPQEDELCIIAHSLGTVILWDMLFSDRFEADDPAFSFRSHLQGFAANSNKRQVHLKTMVTMGSPILFINTMLAVQPVRVQEFIQQVPNNSFQWFNILHASDIIAYPLKSNLNLDKAYSSQVEDIYISTPVNSAEQAALLAKQEHVAMAIASAQAHTSYWNCQQTIRTVLTQILPSHNLLSVAVNWIRNVPGITPCGKVEFTAFEKMLDVLIFKDGSGKLQYITNPANVPHVRILGRDGSLFFAGYVGWLHTTGLEEAIDFIKRNFC